MYFCWILKKYVCIQFSQMKKSSQILLFLYSKSDTLKLNNFANETTLNVCSAASVPPFAHVIRVYSNVHHHTMVRTVIIGFTGLPWAISWRLTGWLPDVSVVWKPKTELHSQFRSACAFKMPFYLRDCCTRPIQTHSPSMHSLVFRSGW